MYLQNNPKHDDSRPRDETRNCKYTKLFFYLINFNKFQLSLHQLNAQIFLYNEFVLEVVIIT